MLAADFDSVRITLADIPVRGGRFQTEVQNPKPGI